MNLAIYCMVYLGALLMVYNIYGFIRYARYLKGRKGWDKENTILSVPIILLVMFLLGYLAVGIFGKPDLIVAGILFGGSIYVFIMYKLIFGITERLIKNEQLEVEQIASEKSNLAKTSFLASVSHEMRTPMNVILGLVAVALKKPHLDPEAREPLEKINNSGKYLLSLINNVIDLNSIEKGTFTTTDEDFSLSETITQLNAIVDTLCSDKGLTYNVTVGGDACMIYTGDGLILSEALLTILDNAVKYTNAPGSVNFTVEAGEPADGYRELRFTIADTGIGIDSEFLPKVFDLFTQEDAGYTRLYGGSGLGLAAARRKIELIGGRIDVTSEKNVGSVFTVTVKLKISPNQEPEPAEEPETDISLAGKRIMIVEDIDDNAEIVADLLDLEDCESDRAENGKIAVEMFAASPLYRYDAILMDLRMPVMDGHEAAVRIRALDRADAKTVPILALTANSSEADKKKSLESGMDAHLEKPADADELYSALKKYIAAGLRKVSAEK